MTILRTDHRETMLTQPALYCIGTGCARPCLDRAAAPAVAGLLVALQGDFLVVPTRSERCGGNVANRQRSHSDVTIDGRPPLGCIERLADHATIVVSRGAGRESVRWFYVRSGPPVEFALPVGAAVRCAYSFKTLAGATAVRCPGCVSLYHKTAAWETELGRRCPVCGWAEDQGADRC
jgi:hypothetical protein